MKTRQSPNKGRLSLGLDSSSKQLRWFIDAKMKSLKSSSSCLVNKRSPKRAAAKAKTRIKERSLKVALRVDLEEDRRVLAMMTSPLNLTQCTRSTRQVIGVDRKRRKFMLQLTQ